MAGKSTKYRSLKPFGMIEYAFDLTVNDRIEKAKRNNYIYVYFKRNRKYPTSMAEKETLDDMWNKLSLTHQWSNIYFVNSAHTKLRSLGISVNNIGQMELDEDQVELMAQLEHNRWNVEKLLMGYRMTTPGETELISRDIHDKGKDSLLKKHYSEKHFAHYDIIAYSDLKPDASGESASYYDKCLIRGIPLLYQKP